LVSRVLPVSGLPRQPAAWRGRRLNLYRTVSVQSAVGVWATCRRRAPTMVEVSRATQHPSRRELPHTPPVTVCNGPQPLDQRQVGGQSGIPEVLLLVTHVIRRKAGNALAGELAGQQAVCHRSVGDDPNAVRGAERQQLRFDILVQHVYWLERSDGWMAWRADLGTLKLRRPQGSAFHQPGDLGPGSSTSPPGWPVNEVEVDHTPSLRRLSSASRRTPRLEPIEDPGSDGHSRPSRTWLPLHHRSWPLQRPPTTPGMAPPYAAAVSIQLMPRSMACRWSLWSHVVLRSPTEIPLTGQPPTHRPMVEVVHLSLRFASVAPSFTPRQKTIVCRPVVDEG
jgi:hypothetical protein